MLHACQQPRQLDAGVRRPVTVMTTVDIHVGTVNGDVDGGDAPRPELKGRLIAVIHGAVADVEHLGVEELPILFSERLQERGAGLFLAFIDELQVSTVFDAGGFHGVHGC